MGNGHACVKRRGHGECAEELQHKNERYGREGSVDYDGYAPPCSRGWNGKGEGMQCCGHGLGATRRGVQNVGNMCCRMVVSGVGARQARLKLQLSQRGEGGAGMATSRSMAMLRDEGRSRPAARWRSTKRRGRGAAGMEMGHSPLGSLLQRCIWQQLRVRGRLNEICCAAHG